MKPVSPRSDDEIISALREIEVPEPSPLFWDHLSQRVRDAVAQEPAVPRAWTDRFNFAWAGGIAVAIALLAFGVTLSVRHQPAAGSATMVMRPAVVEGSAAGTVPASLSDDASWAVMGELASEIDFDQAGAAGLAVGPGAADAALSQLSGDEQRSAIELLQQEIKRSRRL